MCGPFCFLTTNHSALSSPTFLLLPPHSLDSEQWLARNLGSSGQGVSMLLRVWTSASDQEGVLHVSSSPDGFRSLVPPCYVLPHTALLPEAPPGLWAALAHSSVVECSPSLARSGFNPSFAWLHTTPLLREPEMADGSLVFETSSQVSAYAPIWKESHWPPLCGLKIYTLRRYVV